MARSGGGVRTLALACGLAILSVARAAASAPEAETESEPPESPPAARAPAVPLDLPVIERDPSWLTHYSVGALCWFSWGDSERSHSGPGPLGDYADPLSELTWRNLVSEVLEVSASARLFRKVIVNVEAGVGAVSSGNLQDQDFAFAGREGLFSDSISPVPDDNLWYVNANVGWRCYENDLFALDCLFGYQFWREKYVAVGGAQVAPPNGNVFPPGPVITEQFTWHGFRLGFQSITQVWNRLQLKSRVMLMPITHLEVQDTHHLRTDFRQDPSGFDRADSGFGVMADIRFSYWLWRFAYLELGYRIWDAKSGSGDTSIRFSDGTEANLLFNDGHTTRQGLTLGLNLLF